MKLRMAKAQFMMDNSNPLINKSPINKPIDKVIIENSLERPAIF